MTMAPEEPDALKTKPVPVTHWEFDEGAPEADGAAPPEGEAQRRGWFGRHWKSAPGHFDRGGAGGGRRHRLLHHPWERNAVPDGGGHNQRCPRDDFDHGHDRASHRGQRQLCRGRHREGRQSDGRRDRETRASARHASDTDAAKRPRAGAGQPGHGRQQPDLS